MNTASRRGLTLSNSLLRPEHLTDPDCNALYRLFQEQNDPQNGAIVHAELLTQYLKKNYPSLYLVSSTTKVLTDFNDLQRELARPEFRYVVPDFRLNRAFDRLAALPQSQKDKVEFLCNECCWFGCTERRACYEAVSRKNLGLPGPEHYCSAPGAAGGYRFSRAMANPGFIGIKAIRDTYLPRGFTQFKIEGRGLGSALILEFLLHYLTRPEYQLAVREELYLDTMLDLFLTDFVSSRGEAVCIFCVVRLLLPQCHIQYHHHTEADSKEYCAKVRVPSCDISGISSSTTT